MVIYTSSLAPQEQYCMMKAEVKVKKRESPGRGLRIKKLIWLPPDVYGICGRNCEGCVAKCAEQSLEMSELTHKFNERGEEQTLPQPKKSGWNLSQKPDQR